MFRSVLTVQHWKYQYYFDENYKSEGGEKID